MVDRTTAVFSDRTRSYNPGNNPGNARPGSETPGGRPSSFSISCGRPSNPTRAVHIPAAVVKPGPSGPGSVRPGNAYPGGRPSQPQQQMPSRPQPQSRPRGFKSVAAAMAAEDQPNHARHVVMVVVNGQEEDKNKNVP